MLIAAILIAGVSSIYNGSSAIFFEVSKNLSNCSSDILPLLISFELILACSEIILVDNCSEDISSEKKAIEDASSSLKEALKGTDNEDIKKKTETLVQASMKLGEAIYKSQEKKPDSSNDGDKNDEGKKDDNVVDADFEEVKEENKDQDKEEEKEKSA